MVRQVLAKDFTEEGEQETGRFLILIYARKH
jgi:hypothetical protein